MVAPETACDSNWWSQHHITCTVIIVNWWYASSEEFIFVVVRCVWVGLGKIWLGLSPLPNTCSWRCHWFYLLRICCTANCATNQTNGVWALSWALPHTAVLSQTTSWISVATLWCVKRKWQERKGTRRVGPSQCLQSINTNNWNHHYNQTL